MHKCRLDSSESPAEVLGSLCERLRFSPEAALELHRMWKRELWLNNASLEEWKAHMSGSDVFYNTGPSASL
eukprot:1160512-Pelagomonas_calceolata.AAC.10